MPYIHCCGSVMSPGVGFDMGGCTIKTHNYFLYVTIVCALTHMLPLLPVAALVPSRVSLCKR